MAKSKNLSLSTQIFTITVILLAFGLLMIYSASVAEALRNFSDKYYFTKLQLKWSLLGLLVLLITAKINLKRIEAIAPVIMLFGIFLLVIVLVPEIGSKVQGARRWIQLPGFALQPSELIKLIEVIYLASWLNTRKVTQSQFLGFIGLTSILVLLQPDMGTTIVLVLIAISMYYISNYPVKQILTIMASGGVIGLLLILTSPYRAARLMTFLNPSNDPGGTSYHIRQILLALGSGGIFGLGIGKSRQKYQYLPESTTDSIFAVIGEELGFIGTMGLILLFTLFLSIIFRVAIKSKRPFNRALAGGIGAWIALQIVLNLASIVALTPLTGVPLPLVSYGGSSLVTMMAGIGLVMNVAKKESI